jgi:hypothetical protein
MNQQWQRMENAKQIAGQSNLILIMLNINELHQFAERAEFRFLQRLLRADTLLRV